MSLKLRLLVTVVSLVVVTSLMLAAIHLNNVATAELAHFNERSATTAQLVKSWITHRVGELAPLPSTTPLKEISSQWQDAIASDPEVIPMLTTMMAPTRSIVEISLAGPDSRITASTTKDKIGTYMPTRLTLRDLLEEGPLDRLTAIFLGSFDYETRVDLAILGESTPLFRIQVLVSSVLIRNALIDRFMGPVLLTLGTLLIAAALAFMIAKVVLRPIDRLGNAIDLIASGHAELIPSIGSPSEFQAVELKLRLLGEQFRGARQGATELRSSMERRLAAINRLTGGVAHEIKNPLNSIALRLELLKNRVLPELPEAEEELGIISQEITRLDRVVRTFLDFTRPVEIETEELDLNGIVDETLSLLGPEANAHGIDVDWKPVATPVRVRGDAGLLKQALWNVCRNAVDAMPSGGLLEVSLRREDGDALLSVKDTGPGIPLAERERVFQLYYSTKPQGSGIGLAMTFRAVQLHGGSIEIGGDDGAGTEITMRVPTV